MAASEISPNLSKSESANAPSPRRRLILNGFLGAGFLSWLSTAVYPVVRYMLPPPGPVMERSAKLGPVDQFPKNSGTIFRIGNKPGLLVRTDSGELRAFVAICTHLDCTVQYKDDEGIIWCACHNGRYNLHGMNISGPPPRPLDPLEVRLKGDEVHVSFIT